jgi:hypothetical protein
MDLKIPFDAAVSRLKHKIILNILLTKLGITRTFEKCNQLAAYSLLSSTASMPVAGLLPCHPLIIGILVSIFAAKANIP